MPFVDPALEYFVAVFETGSVNAAARRLYVASSAISRQIARLERELGVPLFDRLPSGATPTPAGRSFLGFARRTIQEAAAIADEVWQRQTSRAVVTVAGTDGLTRALLPEVAIAFNDEHPDARVVIYQTLPGSVTEMVRDGTADLGVAFSLSLAAGVAVRYSQQSHLHAVVHRDHPLAVATKVSARELVEHTLALSTVRTTNRVLFDTYAASHELVVEPAYECDDPTALLSIVRARHAVTLLSPVTLSKEDRRAFVTIPLKEREFRQRTLQVHSRAGRPLPPAAEEFGELLEQALERAHV